MACSNFCSARYVSPIWNCARAAVSPLFAAITFLIRVAAGSYCLRFSSDQPVPNWAR